MKTETPPDTRSLILLRAAELFYGEGIRAISMDRIAEAVGVTKKTLYYHFRSKDDLIEAYLVAREETREVLPYPNQLTRVPGAKAWVKGLANVRGTLYGVVDFASFNGQPAIVPGGRARLLLIGARHGIHSALLVSASTGLRSHDDFEPATAGAAPPWVARRLRDMQGREWLQLDAARLLAQPAFLDAGLD